MTAKDIDPRVLDKVDEGKRDALRKLLTGATFAVPVVSTFSLDGLIGSANAQIQSYVSNQTTPGCLPNCIILPIDPP